MCQSPFSKLNPVIRTRDRSIDNPTNGAFVCLAFAKEGHDFEVTDLASRELYVEAGLRALHHLARLHDLETVSDLEALPLSA
jgi:hypothetical protein